MICGKFICHHWLCIMLSSLGICVVSAMFEHRIETDRSKKEGGTISSWMRRRYSDSDITQDALTSETNVNLKLNFNQNTATAMDVDFAFHKLQDIWWLKTVPNSETLEKA